MKLLTISIAAYNVEKYIRCCLEKIEKSKYLNLLEVFIIDDGGNDGTLNIAKDFSKRHPDVFIPIHKNNAGWGSTLNYSIEHSNAKYFKQLDGDDYFDTEGLDCLLNYLSNSNSDIVFSPYELIDDATSQYIKTITCPISIDIGKEYMIEEVISELTLAMHMCTVKTSIITNLRLLENCFYTDVEFIIKSIANASTISFIDSPVYCYRIARDGQSVSISGFKKHYLEHQKVLMELIHFTNSVTDERKKKAFVNRLRRMSGDQYVAYMCLDINSENKNKMLAFDLKLKEYPEFYDTDLKIARLARAFNGLLYPLLASYVHRR